MRRHSPDTERITARPAWWRPFEPAGRPGEVPAVLIGQRAFAAPRDVSYAYPGQRWGAGDPRSAGCTGAELGYLRAASRSLRCSVTMPFKQARRPCLLLRREELSRFRRALRTLGYRRHRGLRSERAGEVEAWLGRIGRGEQIHVQCASAQRGFIEVYAHTEPAGQGLVHLVSALLDAADFRRGERRLLADLREAGWQVERYRPRL